MSKNDLGSDGMANYSNKLQRFWQAIINHPDNHQDKFLGGCGEMVVTAGGV